jgi:glycosyltransferase involved in cell wall biosynthesis
MVLYFGWELGGGETYTLDLKECLEKQGHTVKIFASNNSPEKVHFTDYEFVDFKSRFLKILFSFFNYRSYFTIKKALKDFKPDIIHIQSLDISVTSSVISAIKDVPVIISIHSYDLLKPLKKIVPSLLYRLYWYFKWYFNSFFLKQIQLFIIPHKYFMNLIEKENFKPNILIYYGKKLFKYSKLQHKRNLLFYGRLAKEKGVSYLIQSMPEIINNFPDVNLTIVGAGPQKKELEYLINKLNISANVVFTGRITNEKLQKLRVQSDIILVPSTYDEPFGLVGVEAMSVGRPVIASRVGGIPEWLDDGKTGFLVDPGNSEQIAEKVIKLFSDKKLLEEMGKNAHKKAEQFSIDKHTKKIEKIYLEVIKKYKTK